MIEQSFINSASSQQFMNVNGQHYRTIWLNKDNECIVEIIDQTKLPFDFCVEQLNSVGDVVRAIKEMHVRGAGLIGATAGYGMYLAALEAPKDNGFNKYLEDCGGRLKATRPTAVNLATAVDEQFSHILKPELSIEEKIGAVKYNAECIAFEDAAACHQIGLHGFSILSKIETKKRGERINILTHCNAGWLAFVDYGSALSPIYKAFDAGVKVHVWVDETRPRNQGARLTAWELEQHGVPHTVIPDNVGGHLMQHSLVDMVIVGADRVTRNGDVANKIGTYLKALAANDNHVPFYVAFPSSTFDFTMRDGVKNIPIEQRGGEEVKYIDGLCGGEVTQVLLTPKKSNAANYGFDVTPAKLITGLITERGICSADEDRILELFPEKKDL